MTFSGDAGILNVEQVSDSQAVTGRQLWHRWRHVI